MDVASAGDAGRLIAAMRDMGCHQTDIGDAFYVDDGCYQPNQLSGGAHRGDVRHGRRLA
jgi:hypothetical protein